MPPSRKKAVASSSKSTANATASATTKARRSKLAKEHDLTVDEEAEIRAAFDLFASDEEDDGDHDDDHDTTKRIKGRRKDVGPSTIATSNVRRCLVALNTPPTDAAELRELLEALDPDEAGRVTFEHFIAVAALKLHHARDARDDEARAEEVAHAFRLFTKGQERDITMQDLRRVARELKEDVPENVLQDMLREATGGGLGPVGMEEFEDVMKRAGVFG